MQLPLPNPAREYLKRCLPPSVVHFLRCERWRAYQIAIALQSEAPHLPEREREWLYAELVY
jgi:hypothetical protein